MRFSSILEDGKLKEEMLDRLHSGGLPMPFVPAVDNATILSIIEVPEEAERLIPGSEVESIILLFGRPVVAIQGNSFEAPQSEVWQQRLESARGHLEAAIPSVGRVELKNHPSYDWVGTGWLVAEDVIVTNRHVAEIFGTQSGAGFVFRHNSHGRRIGARLDFLEEFRTPEEAEFQVSTILHIEPPNGPDIALLRIEGGDLQGRPPIDLAATVASGQDVAVIGYPARDSRIPDPAVAQRIFGNIYDVKRLAPGKVTLISQGELEHDCSTLGGNSGSVVLDLSTGQAVGLHFAGAYRTANYAVSSEVIRDRLAQVA